MWLVWMLGACAPDPGRDDTAAPALPTQCQDPAIPGQISFPEDDGRHDEPVEWWYWTGHLNAPDGRVFGFEEVFFAANISGLEIVMNHVAFTDGSAGTFDHDVLLEVAETPFIPNGFDHRLGANSAVGGGGHDVLHAEPPNVVMDLVVDELERPVPHHGDGYTDYDFGGYTWYYSRERMSAEGTVVIRGETIPVTGSAWFDHQWGDLAQAVTVGWDWFALQLDDGREVMIFVTRPESGTDIVGATLTNADCTVTEIPGSDIEITPLREWTSPTTGCVYPIGWDVAIGDLHLVVDPVMDAQEVPDGNPTYWEGQATVTGDATGMAYVELTGYCAP